MLRVLREERAVRASRRRQASEIFEQTRAREVQIDGGRMRRERGVERVQRREIDGAAARDANRERREIGERGGYVRERRSCTTTGST